MSLTKKDPSLRVAASDPHLVSLGGGRLSTAVTIHYIHVGEYNLPRLQLTCAALQGQQQLQVALIKMSNKRDLTNVRENLKWNLNKKKLKLNLKLKRTEKAKQQTQFFWFTFRLTVLSVCVMSRCPCVWVCVFAIRSAHSVTQRNPMATRKLLGILSYSIGEMPS